ncbi:hypothetical protein OJF2_44850 [Aquisphaera giovannonii]|uniref:DUF998 domain-containing protein n=1 Tax=Aquisphaera giovannonii TaxID=406548 RepID=A0A5B9W5P2_9BACT|nr:hypothetical protein [Aquisphaera giovannonii]QEH35928.1 hypothetical protein OJF2_44850 [Aquisphaera giovannonii]
MEPAIQQLPESTHTLVVSYMGLRRAIGEIGLLLPIVLGPVGRLAFGIEIQDNMSSYYHTPLRDVFVGSMCAIGVFLYCYRGYDWIESWTGKVGCTSALGVALCPLDPGSDPLSQRSVLGYLHTLSGGAFFLTLAFYSLYHFPSTQAGKHEVAPHESQRNFVYRASGVVILLSMAAMGGYLFLLPAGPKRLLNDFNFLFWMEWVAVWAFAAAWLTKGRAILADIALDLLALPVELLRRHEAVEDVGRRVRSLFHLDPPGSQGPAGASLEGPAAEEP